MLLYKAHISFRHCNSELNVQNIKFEQNGKLKTHIENYPSDKKANFEHYLKVLTTKTHKT